MLYDGGTKRPLGLVDGPWAPEGIEQRANSFAAMFLMPLALVDRLRDELGRPTIDRLADAVVSGLHVSQRTAREHVLNIDKNRHLIDDT